MSKSKMSQKPETKPGESAVDFLNAVEASVRECKQYAFRTMGRNAAAEFAEDMLNVAVEKGGNECFNARMWRETLHRLSVQALGGAK